MSQCLEVAGSFGDELQGFSEQEAQKLRLECAVVHTLEDTEYSGTAEYAEIIHLTINSDGEDVAETFVADIEQLANHRVAEHGVEVTVEVIDRPAAVLADELREINVTQRSEHLEHDVNPCTESMGELGESIAGVSEKQARESSLQCSVASTLIGTEFTGGAEYQEMVFLTIDSSSEDIPDSAYRDLLWNARHSIADQGVEVVVEVADGRGRQP